LAKVDLERVRRTTQHVNVRACAEDSRLQTRDDDDANFRMLEAESLNRVCQFDIDAEIVRIELELIAISESLVFLDVHREPGHGSIDLEPPVFVLLRRCLEQDFRI